ncbi:integrase family protein [Methylocaldum marinum]|uniref:Integrase family protein n=1 Tax=Methylocaldum marinum TaxID=1432792 RepID=A0A250KZF5_9GAMM|nr:hypothetical protein [Methylocaldum marinum]BBA37015.1 integrase family protein [Methylocaldum marinum]
MSSPSAADFDRLYQSHLKHLKLKGLQPNTIDTYARTIRRAGGPAGTSISGSMRSPRRN